MSPFLFSSFIPLDSGGVEGRAIGSLGSSLDTEPLRIPRSDDAEGERVVALGVKIGNDGVAIVPSR